MMKQFVGSEMTKRVLVVEDDPALQSLYKTLLTQENFDVTVCTTVEQATTFVTNNQADIILLDIMLPGGQNGFDFLEFLSKKDNLKKIPVLVLTNLNQEQVSAKKMGVVEWLVKTNVSAREVVDKIKANLKV